ncbi:sperm acrosome membrane-associated protein 3 isoform X3 [Arvicanthis niloticus]|uniref:sperm acrosome membrane-associated protein 3 isoform X3 n=1 Tax=Arvicanthis niloticus TaxID=61156 RepID=UPI00402BD18D
MRGNCLDLWSGLVNCLPSHSSALYLCHRMEAKSRAPRRQLCSPGITWLALAYLLSCLLASSKAKVFSRCELAKVLHNFGLDGYRGYNLADWVCLAYYASGFNTAAVDHEADGSTNNGIFQISSRKWCKNLAPNGPNFCRIYCTDLLKNDLKDSVMCVMKIVQEPLGLGYWEAWRHHCQGRDLSDWVDGCDF